VALLDIIVRFRYTSNMPKFTALPDRVILRFPPAVEKIGLIHVPETRALRAEFGELESIGDGLSEETRAMAAHIKERARAGERFLVFISSGTYYWREEMGPEYEDLKNLRSYRISELAVTVAE